MNLRALKTIKAHNWSFNRKACIALVDTYKNLIAKKYPEGIPSDQYFVLPGFEHVTKNQPIIQYSELKGEFELSTTTKFII